MPASPRALSCGRDRPDSQAWLCKTARAGGPCRPQCLLSLMNGTRKDIDPTTELLEEDEDQTLPEPESAIDLAAGAGPLGQLASGRRHHRSCQARAVLARRLSHDRCQRRGALRRQSQEHPQTDRRLYPPDRLRPAHRAHDRRDRIDRIRLDRDRDRGAAARGQPDQAAAPALQRAAARRQVVSLHPDHRRPLGAADPKAPRRAQPRRAVITGRSPRSGRSTAPSPRCSAPFCCAPAPTVSSRAARGRACSTRSSVAPVPARARSSSPNIRELVREANAFLSGTQPGGEGRAGRRNGKGVGRARFRARRDLSRPAGRALGGAVASGHQSARRRGGRRVRRASGRRFQLRRGVLLPHRPELGQPRLFPEGRPIALAPARCWARFSPSSTTTSRARAASSSRTRSRSARSSPRRSAPRAATRSR